MSFEHRQDIPPISEILRRPHDDETNAHQHSNIPPLVPVDEFFYADQQDCGVPEGTDENGIVLQMVNGDYDFMPEEHTEGAYDPYSMQDSSTSFLDSDYISLEPVNYDQSTHELHPVDHPTANDGFSEYWSNSQHHYLHQSELAGPDVSGPNVDVLGPNSNAIHLTSTYTWTGTEAVPTNTLRGYASSGENGPVRILPSSSYGGRSGGRSGLGRARSGSAPTGGSNKKKKPRRRVPTPAQRRAANIRERKRMFNLNGAFDYLRKSIPTFAYEKHLSRIETLRLAIGYIRFMKDLLDAPDDEMRRKYANAAQEMAVKWSITL